MGSRRLEPISSRSVRWANWVTPIGWTRRCSSSPSSGTLTQAGNSQELPAIFLTDYCFLEKFKANWSDCDCNARLKRQHNTQTGDASDKILGGMGLNFL